MTTERIDQKEPVEQLWLDNHGICGICRQPVGELESTWKRRACSLELFRGDQRVGGVKCFKHREGFSVFAARVGRRMICPVRAIGYIGDGEGNFLRLWQAKLAVQATAMETRGERLARIAP